MNTILIIEDQEDVKLMLYRCAGPDHIRKLLAEQMGGGVRATLEGEFPEIGVELPLFVEDREIW